MSFPSNTPPIVHRSWKRRLARWLFVTVVGSVVLVTIVNLIRREETRIEGTRELTEATATADRDDPDWRWEQLCAARKKPPEGKNGAELIPQIKKLSHADWGKWQAKPEWKAPLETPPNVQFSPRLLAEVRRDADASPEAIKLARTLKDRPFGHRDIVLTPNVLDTLLTDTQDTRHVVDMLRWDVVLAVEAGDGRRAADSLLAALNAARSIGDEPFMISQLVRMAGRSITVRSTERVIAQTPDAPGLTELQAALAAEAEEPLMLHGIRGERAMFDRLMENLENGTAIPDKAIDSGFRSTWAQFGWWHYRVNLLGDRAYMLDWMTQAVQAARLPLHEQAAAFAALPVPPPDSKRMMSRLFLPAVEKVGTAYLRTTAELRCAVAGIACERFRHQHKRWPDSLTELVPAFLPAVPLDPYGGQTLRYAKWVDGVAVYSVGKKPPQTHGFQLPPEPSKPGLPEGVEFGFRLWNPDQRRLPPPPDPPEPPPEP